MTHSDEIIQISTPENVAFEYSIAGIGSRFIAALVDSSIIGLLQLVVIFFSILIVVIITDSPGAAGSDFAGWLLALMGLIGFGFLWGYYIFFELIMNGQSPGKRMVGLRVIRTDGGPVSLTESVIRNLIRVIDFLPMLYGVGVVAMFIDPKSRRLGDLAAGTLVVRERRGGIQFSSSPQIRPGWPFRTQPLENIDQEALRKLPDEDLATIESLLKRRSEFSDPQGLAQQILVRVYERMEITPPVIEPVQSLRLLEDILYAARGGYNSRQ